MQYFFWIMDLCLISSPYEKGFNAPIQAAMQNGGWFRFQKDQPMKDYLDMSYEQEDRKDLAVLFAVAHGAKPPTGGT